MVSNDFGGKSKYTDINIFWPSFVESSEVSNLDDLPRGTAIDQSTFPQVKPLPRTIVGVGV
jgi:hypothetical protein